MHNIKTNFVKYYEIIKENLHGIVNEDFNKYKYRHVPKMNDCEVLALAFTAHSLGIDSENLLFSKLKTEYKDDFPNLIDRTNFNRRRKGLESLMKLFNTLLSNKIDVKSESIIIDSMPLPICQNARIRRSKICKETAEYHPARGYSAVSKSYLFGYKLHLLVNSNGVYASHTITPANVHDIKGLQRVDLQNQTGKVLVGDKAYFSQTVQTDLFQSHTITLKTPQKSNMKHIGVFTDKLRISRKRIETLFSQLCDQFMIKRNYAKTFIGFKVRIETTLASVGIMQWLNFKANRPLNRLKTALQT